MPITIRKFIEDYGSLLRPDDLQTLAQIHCNLEQLATKKLITNVNGTHYDDCMWSDPTTDCGPDTCPCNFKNPAVELRKAHELMSFYIDLVDKLTTVQREG